ncbi:MAG: LysR family transcriptional regulator [Alphaproteobacteria bacterium]|nr:LysR family transcriptional regulator [Alphaproteobacteria bacterium]
MNWEDLQLFLTVAKTKSIAEAANALKVSYSTLSRRIGKLEKSLGATLFIRQHGTLELTTEGNAVLSSAGKMATTVTHLERELKGIDKKMEGTVRVTLTQSALCGLVLPHLPDFQQEYPGIFLDFDTSREFRDILKGEADVAVRITDNHEYKVPDNLLGLRLPSIHVHPYAQKTIATRINAGKGDAGKTLIKWDKRINFRKMAAYFGMEDWPVTCAIDDTGAQLAAVCNGVGVGILPCYLGENDPKVARVKTSAPPLPALDAWAVAHPDMRDVEKIRTVLRFIAGCFEKHEKLVTGA